MVRKSTAGDDHVQAAGGPTDGRRSDERLHMLSRAVEQGLNMVVITDPSGIIEYVNPGFTATTGYTPEEAIGRHVSRLGQLSPEQEERLWEAIASGGEWRGEFQNRKKCGTLFWLSASVSPIQSPDGVITHFLGCGEDITERKRAEEALRESEEKFRALAETVTAATFVFQDARVRYASSASEALTGYSREELLEMKFWDLVHPDYRDMVKSRGLARQRGEHVPRRYKIKILTKGGEERWLDVSGDTVEFEGRPAVIGTALDITERKRAEEALRQSEELYRELVENIPEVVTEVDASGRITYISSATQEVSGYTPAEITGAPFSQFIHPDDLAIAQERFKRVLSGRRETLDFRVHSKSGGVVWVQISSRPILDGDRVIGLRGVLTDITDRKRTEEALRESEERFRSAFEHAATGMALVGTDGRLLRVNRSCCESLGYSEQELTSTTWQAITHPDDLVATLEHVRRVLAGEADAFQIEKRFIHKLGHVMWGHVTSSLLRDAEGRPVHFITQIQDITERKRAEEALRESETKFRTLAETTLAAIAVIQGEKFRYVNPATEAISGYTRDELMGMDFWDLVHPDFREPNKGRGFAWKRGESVPTRYEFKIITKDGDERWLDFTAGLTQFDGKLAVLGAAFDITVRKHAEEALRESQERYRDLVENINDVIYAVDESGRISYISPVIEQLSGYRPAEVIGRSFAEFVHPEDLAPLKEGFIRNLSGNPEPNEYRALARSGEVRWVRTFSRPIQVEDRIVGLRGVLTDVTARKRAEEAVREREETVLALLNAATESALLVEPNGKILALNQTAAQRLNRSVEDLVGLSVFDLMPPGVAAYRRANGDEVVESREPVRFEDERDGRWFDTTIYPIVDAEGNVARLAIYARDVTERKRAEEAQQEARERLESRVEHRLRRDSPYRLTFRELTVLHLVAAGKSDKDIATELVISPRTANKHVENILAKMGASSRTEAGVRAVREGLVD